MPEAGKTLAVLGSDGTGKATTIGHLIYKCGGIDMMTLERLEKGCNNIYAKAFKEIQTREGEPCFYTPMHKVTITKNLSNADGLLLIVTPYDTKKQLQELGGIAKQFLPKKIVVVVNKLDEVNWSEDAFIRSVQATRTVFQELGDFKEQYARRKILYVPASGLHGDNLLELSSSLGWYSKITGSGEEGLEGAVTAVAALDRILS